MSLVSVIISVYNCENFIVQCVDSILAQSYKDLEILVCDDASTDGTWGRLSQYSDPRLRLFVNKKNQGVVHTRNFLLSQATGEFIMIQDGDDWSDPRRVEVLIEQFGADGQLAACATAHYRVNHEGRSALIAKNRSFYLGSNDCLALPFMPATMMVRRIIWEEIGGYHSFFSGLYGEDWYWVLRIVERYRFYYLKDPLYYYRFNAASLTNSFSQPEKLIIGDLMREVVGQRRTLGTDWIEQNDAEAVNKFTHEKFKNNKWLSEQYRVEAAVQRDGSKRWMGLKLVIRALLLNPLSFKNYVTLKYVCFA